MLRYVRVAIAASLLLGCASPRLETRDQWLAESQRLYADRDPEQVIRAAEAILQAAAPGNVTFAHNLDGFTATRSWFVTVIIASVAGRDTFDFKAVREAGGTRATLRVDRRSRDSEGGGSDGSISFVASYRHFFASLDYALGKRQDWVTCQQASEKFGIENANVGSALCGPGFTSQMANPMQPRPEWTRPGAKVLVVPGATRDTITRR
jgi:hypothetical protein